MSRVDPTVFSWYDNNGELIEVLAAHFDDFIWGGGGTEKFRQTVIEHVRQCLNVGRDSQNHFKYLSLELCLTDEEILVYPESFASSLNPIKLSKPRSLEKHSAATDEERQELSSKV